ncbi:MAG: UbiD family decarboxylase [Archaeoglobaceae archaeon]|nr:UbiD family decarboxylase [Archaeoglobaceae archaeon]MCX8152693.1 UbiD family decarboxylase [Archaeoglobaceae archaeon]MDW8013259.1 UbiD family decarboxylase [Archaeoglobaceae archaeon]
MDLRSSIDLVKPKVFENELKHYEVIDFLKSKNCLNDPVILNVEGRKVAKNFVSSREMLAKFLKCDQRKIARHLFEIEKREPKIRVKSFDEMKLMKRNTDLYELPILKYFPRDGGRYVTAGVVIAKGRFLNASIHRMMLLDEKSFAVRLVPPRHTYVLWREALEVGEDLKVAVAIGVHPLILFAAATRVPEGEEFQYASKLFGELEVYEKNGFLIPESEIVLFGRITSERVKEGPFLDITGTYDKVRDEPVLVVDEMHLKKDFIYYSITPSLKEHQVLMGIPYEPVIYKFVSNVCKVKNVAMTPGSFHYFHCIVQIEKISEGDAKNAIIAALAANPSLKCVLVVDEDVDIFDYEDVEFAVATRFQPDKDLVVVSGARVSSLDPSAGDTGAKWGIDATKPLKDGRFERVKV